MLWTDQWVGIPYEVGARGPSCYDCLGLVQKLLLERKGITITTTEDRLASHHQLYRQSSDGWFEVAKSETGIEGDVLVFLGDKEDALHVAYVVDNTNMIHATSAAGFSVVDRWRRPHWQRLLVQRWRHV